MASDSYSVFLYPSSCALSFLTVPLYLHAAGTEVVKVTWSGFKGFSLNRRYCNAIQRHCTLHSVLCNSVFQLRGKNFTFLWLICPTALFAFHISMQSCISFLSNETTKLQIWWFGKSDFSVISWRIHCLFMSWEEFSYFLSRINFFLNPKTLSDLLGNASSQRWNRAGCFRGISGSHGTAMLRTYDHLKEYDASL